MPQPSIVSPSLLHRVVSTCALALLFALGANGEARAGMEEFDNCTTPKYVVFTNPGNGVDPVVRTVYYSGASAPIVLPANPENNATHAPGHLQNCTRNANPNHVQWLTFKLIARNWFGSANEDHLAVPMRGRFLNFDSSPIVYDARGVIFHRFKGGMMGERFAFNVPGAPHHVESLGVAADPGFFRNGVTYQIEVHASVNGVAYRATNTSTGEAKEWRYHGQIPGDLNTLGTGLGFAVLCTGPGGTCSKNSGFNVYFWDIATGWFAP